jgi:hypothetical protein
MAIQDSIYVVVLEAFNVHLSQVDHQGAAHPHDARQAPTLE